MPRPILARPVEDLMTELINDYSPGGVFGFAPDDATLFGIPTPDDPVRIRAGGGGL